MNELSTCRSCNGYPDFNDLYDGVDYLDRCCTRCNGSGIQKGNEARWKKNQEETFRASGLTRKEYMKRIIDLAIKNAIGQQLRRANK